MAQLSFESLDFAAKKKRTKRGMFLGEMPAVVPWGKLERLIEPHYPKMGPQGGRRPYPLAVMLRIYCLQQWYNLSDPGAEEALYDIQSMRAFAGLELGRDAIPDETTILNFRHLLERNDLTRAIFEGVAEHLAAKGELLRGGTIVDATLIAASPSTKNKEQKRDPEMTSSKKGNQWYFGMKAHIGVDAKSGLVHTAGVTTGKVHDAKVMDNLIREADTAVYGDKGYTSDVKKRAAEEAGVLWAVKEKAKPGCGLTKRQRARNRRFGKMRAKVEHVFRVLKCQFGYRKVRYRGIAKNGAQVFSRLARALADSLMPYTWPEQTATPMNRAGAGRPLNGGSADPGWRMPPIITEAADAISAPGRAYYDGMSQEDMQRTAASAAGFAMGGGGLAAGRGSMLAANASKQAGAAGIANALDMSPEARLARADEMYRPEIVYHGTNAPDDFASFDLSRGGDRTSSRAAQEGVSVAPSASVADEFSGGAFGGFGDGSRILPLRYRSSRQARLTLDGTEKNNEVAATLSGAWDKGFDSVRLLNYSTPGGKTGEQVVVVRNPN